ncbi:CHASE3 domain-containing protein [Frankia sp. AgB1.9]|uniref:sensor histidine kinase n=1 Tax=unclassified Frankia TaxID=2632575 RepID=UPI00193127E0|nr:MULTISPECIES: sensor histidine kinase [unclassified Frankia]MBL7490536.1 CHASE3 domain-containing protein [Frankia sp. AgW1.1]MBL7554137.1 CHASE3 domain-containing protein [Frankia sp. AgB1.9]MBL7625140.1 CHASE3 domain-containing protein [Frankia sp. AgB1.8]
MTDQATVSPPAPEGVAPPGPGRGGRLGTIARSWPLRRRLAAALTITSVILLTGVGLTTASLVQLERAIHERTDIVSPARTQAATLMTSLVDQETGLRGYLLDGKSDALQPYDDGGKAQTAALTRLDQLVGGRPGLSDDLGTLRTRVADWHREYADLVAAAARRGDLAAARAIDPENFGKPSFDAIRAADDRLDTSLTTRAIAARSRVSSTLHQLIAVLIVIGLAFAALMGGIGRSLRLWVTGPIERIAQDASTVAGGDLGHTVARAGPPDVAALADSVENMRLQLVQELGTVWEAAAKLEEQADALRRSNRDLEQFAYVASHDLQEPLRKVASFCQLLERRYGDQLDERGQQYIDFAVDGAKRMQKLINDLLAFSRVGRTTDEFVPVDLGDALGRARQALATAIEASEAEITADPLPTIAGDPTLLAAVFQNLIGNAIKFRGTETPRIHIGVVAQSVVAQSGTWEMSCSDNGIGIEADYAEKIFVIFQRLHRRESYEGTGIGLALVRKIIEFHGGTIWLDTEVKVGTTFRWTLPNNVPTLPTIAEAALPVAAHEGAA